MSNTVGKAFAITVTTPMPAWKTPFLRAVFWVIGTLGIPKKDQQNLVALSFIHFARWVIIPRGGFPRVADSQPAESLKHDVLLFCSNFNGSWEQYIDAFSEVIPGGMNNIWRWSIGYPGSRPITPFLAYIERNQYDNDYYYNATPYSTTTDILHALKLQDELDAFVPLTAGMPADAFQPAFHAFLTRVQDCLATTGPNPLAVAVDVTSMPSLAETTATAAARV